MLGLLALLELSQGSQKRAYRAESHGSWALAYLTTCTAVREGFVQSSVHEKHFRAKSFCCISSCFFASVSFHPGFSRTVFPLNRQGILVRGPNVAGTRSIPSPSGAHGEDAKNRNNVAVAAGSPRWNVLLTIIGDHDDASLASLKFSCSLLLSQV